MEQLGRKEGTYHAHYSNSCSCVNKILSKAFFAGLGIGHNGKAANRAPHLRALGGGGLQLQPRIEDKL